MLSQIFDAHATQNAYNLGKCLQESNGMKGIHAPSLILARPGTSQVQSVLYHNGPALERPPAACAPAPIVLPDFRTATDGPQAQQGILDLVEALKPCWADRRKAVANSGAARKKPLEASNTFTEAEGASRT